MPSLLAVDSETHLIQPGLLTPPGVCGSFYDGEQGWLELFPDWLTTLEGALRPGCVLALANAAYDFGVATAEPEGGCHKGRPELLKLIFEKIARGEVFDILIAAALHYVAEGKLFKDPVTGGPMRLPPGPDGKAHKQSFRYSLELVYFYVTGKADAKANDIYRLRYHEFDGKPLSEYPAEAATYPVDDARNTFIAAKALMAKGANLGQLERHPWTHLTHQTRAAWAMHLMSAWGLRTDGERVAKLRAEVEAEYARTFEKFKAEKLLRWDEKDQEWKDNNAEIKRRVILAYGGDPFSQCPTCAGTGKVPSPTTKKPINCKVCSATGFELPPGVPRTPTDGVKADRDTLCESGDDLLEEFGEASENEKLRTTYLPFLEQGVSKPINVRGNVLVETARASFEGLIQLLPKKGGVRECFRARPRRRFCSVDYNAGELSTLAQVNLWLFGYSRMAEAINAGKDLHSILASQMVGRTYEEFRAEVKAKNPTFTNYRFAAKAGNFGFGGLMGAAKFVLTQRKAKGFPGADGIKHGSMCRLGGCEVLPCGTNKITEWKGRECPPVCVQCCDFSETLRKAWLSTWEEMDSYFKWVKAIPGVKDGEGQMICPGTGYVRGGMNASAAANMPFQHLMAMGAKHALWKVSLECYTDSNSPLFGCRPVVFAHDEIIAEIPEEVQHEAAFRMRDVMVAAMKEFVPDVAMGAEPAICEYWFKDMAPVFQGGRLIPWEPGMIIDPQTSELIGRKAA